MTSAIGDRICFCCHRRESRIDHVRVGPAGKTIAERVRALMSWYRP
jgi:hypothetical protein